MAHISGFVLNSTCKQDEAYISEGWKSMRVLNEVSDAATYVSYVRMTPSEKSGIMTGSVHVLSDSRVEAVFSGVRFRLIKKKMLGRILAFHDKETPESLTSALATPEAQTPQEQLSQIDSLMAAQVGGFDVPPPINQSLNVRKTIPPKSPLNHSMGLDKEGSTMQAGSGDFWTLR